MNRRRALAALFGLPLASRASAQTVRRDDAVEPDDPRIELIGGTPKMALSFTHPMCPICGMPLWMPSGYLAVGELLPVECEKTSSGQGCGWKGHTTRGHKA